MNEAIAVLNIEHFRQVLTQSGLSLDKRIVIQQLLAEEEQKLARLRRRV